MRKILKISLFFIFLIIAIVSVCFYLLKELEAPVNKNDTGKSYILKVPSGTGTKTIALQLENNGIIKSADYFYYKALYKKLSVKAGVYTFYDNQTVDDIFKLLEAGHEEQISVSIPEGLTLSKIAGLLKEKDVIESEEKFIAEASDSKLLEKYHIPAKNAEGYLFPDTYFFNPSTPEKNVVERLLNNCFSKFDELHISVEDPDKLHEIVILASIVEREYRKPEEAPLIASVFTNRLKQHIGLQSCATVVYILTEIEGRAHPERITYEDLKIDSPYNTYKWAGLPAGPISNPGKTALAAAAMPPKTNYYFFRVEDADAGTHHFSTTLEEHATVGRQLAVKAAAGK